MNKFHQRYGKTIVLFLLFLMGFLHGFSQRFSLLNSYAPSAYYSEDIGCSVELDHYKNMGNSFLVSAYYSTQTSMRRGFGIWYHYSGFITSSVYPNAGDLNWRIGGNFGVSILILEAKVQQNFKQHEFNFIPGLGLGFNRYAYVMLDYHIRKQLQNKPISWRFVVRIPIFGSNDYKSGVPPKYFD